MTNRRPNVYHGTCVDTLTFSRRLSCSCEQFVPRFSCFVPLDARLPTSTNTEFEPRNGLSITAA